MRSPSVMTATLMSCLGQACSSTQRSSTQSEQLNTDNYRRTTEAVLIVAKCVKMECNGLRKLRSAYLQLLENVAPVMQREVQPARLERQFVVSLASLANSGLQKSSQSTI
jgi:hypothetical protein